MNIQKICSFPEIWKKNPKLIAPKWVGSKSGRDTWDVTCQPIGESLKSLAGERGGSNELNRNYKVGCEETGTWDQDTTCWVGMRNMGQSNLKYTIGVCFERNMKCGEKECTIYLSQKRQLMHPIHPSCMCVANKHIFISEEMFITLLALGTGLLVCIPKVSCWTFLLLNMHLGIKLLVVIVYGVFWRNYCNYLCI